MKKIYSLLVLSLFVGLQCFGQRYIKLYQDDVVIKQLSTEEIDSISITETEPHIVNFWYDGKIFLNYNAAGIDSITVTNNGKPPLSYAGVVAFNSELKIKDLDILAPSTADEYENFIKYDLTQKNGTILYYAFDKALNILHDNANNIVTPLESVHVITFTDGLDQGSLMLTDKYGSSVEYLNALRNRMAQTKVSGLSPQFYSVGLRGSDVSNVELFRQNLRGLASSDANAFEVNSINEIGSKFYDIEKQIQNVSTRQSMTFKVPGVESGTRMRFVFDNQAAENSQLYIEGTFNLQDRCLHDVVYHGIKAVSGKTIQGTQDGIFLTYTFTGMHRETGTSLIPTSSVAHYYKYPSSTSWQYNSEFSGTTSSQENVSHTGTAILLIIDCSSSLTDEDFWQIRQSASSFLSGVADNAERWKLSGPQNFKAVFDENKNVVNLSWDAVNYAQSYRVYRSSGLNGNYTLVADNVKGNSWTDESPLQACCYKVSAIYLGGKSILSESIYYGLEYIDLGLPSGLLWATCNVGASKPEEYGDYFAWGETKPKADYSWSTYKWGSGERWLTKYNPFLSYGANSFTDRKITLDLADDAACANWGGEWRMPTKADIKELLDNTSTQWVDNYNGTGVAGMRFTGANGNDLFLPAAGDRAGTLLNNAGSDGYYWSSSLGCDVSDSGEATGRPWEARELYFSSYGAWCGPGGNPRYVGFPVRPVRPKN
ncbi:fibronectin type III domain-containing protein [Pseudoprevotella muciniphila]|nr:hypothetical protein [Pseudoprevotella muciniphila]